MSYKRYARFKYLRAIEEAQREIAEAASVKTKNTIGGTSGTIDIDASLGNYFAFQAAGNTTFTISNIPEGVYSCTIEVDHNSGTITWPSTIKWNGDTAPELTTGNTHLFMFITDDQGTRIRGSALVDYVD